LARMSSGSYSFEGRPPFSPNLVTETIFCDECAGALWIGVLIERGAGHTVRERLAGAAGSVEVREAPQG